MILKRTDSEVRGRLCFEADLERCSSVRIDLKNNRELSYKQVGRRGVKFLRRGSQCLLYLQTPSDDQPNTSKIGID